MNIDFMRKEKGGKEYILQKGKEHKLLKSFTDKYSYALGVMTREK